MFLYQDEAKACDIMTAERTPSKTVNIVLVLFSGILYYFGFNLSESMGIRFTTRSTCSKKENATKSSGALAKLPRLINFICCHFERTLYLALSNITKASTMEASFLAEKKFDKTKRVRNGLFPFRRRDILLRKLIPIS